MLVLGCRPWNLVRAGRTELWESLAGWEQCPAPSRTFSVLEEDPLVIRLGSLMLGGNPTRGVLINLLFLKKPINCLIYRVCIYMSFLWYKDSHYRLCE